jgi:crotonobetainyl-CoA:carnitine CoA-transferase CaiB-like acyl-CoA transferase
MTIAGGIAAALFHRANTGEPSVIDVSLLGLGTWATGLSVTSTLLLGQDMPRPPADGVAHMAFNPIIGTFRTSDGRFVNPRCCSRDATGRTCAATSVLITSSTNDSTPRS